jgi:diaminopimelate decarboxylase
MSSFSDNQSQEKTLTEPHHSVPVTNEHLESIATEYGTPFQLYDEEAIRQNARNLINAFSSKFPQFQQHFAVKALPNPKILQILMEEGCGLDCSSTSELWIANKLNCPGDHVCFTSNFTSKEDLLLAAKQGVLINLDDVSLVQSLADVTANNIGFPELISFRLNPGEGRTDSTTKSNVLGGPDAKFGVAHFQILEAYKKAIECGAKRFGIHMMTGSCVMSNTYWEESLGRMLDTVATIRSELNIEFEFINVGGGIGIPYKPNEKCVSVEELASRMRTVWDAKLKEHNMPEPKLHMENGRYMTGPFGWLVSRCHAIKRSYATYYGLDACMSNLMRPGMYGSYHHISVPKKDKFAKNENVNAAADPSIVETELANIVGTLCENNDWFAKNRLMPKAEIGDLFVIHETGAHSHSMGFQYNGKLRAPELLLKSDGTTIEKIRERESISNLYENCLY